MWVNTNRIVVTLMVGRRLCCFAVRYKSGISWVAVADRSPLSPTLCRTVLLVHLHQLEVSGVQPGKLVHLFLRTDTDVTVNVQIVLGRAVIWSIVAPLGGRR